MNTTYQAIMLGETECGPCLLLRVTTVIEGKGYFSEVLCRDDNVEQIVKQHETSAWIIHTRKARRVDEISTKDYLAGKRMVDD